MQFHIYLNIQDVPKCRVKRINSSWLT